MSSRVTWALSKDDGVSYGTAIFQNEEGQRVVYHLCYPGAYDLETDLKNFKPRGFLEATVEDHDGSGNLMRYVAHGDPLADEDPDA